MASDDPGRRRLLNFVIVAGAALLAAAAAVAVVIVYVNVTTGQLRAQARTQAATIAQLRRQQLAACNATADLGTVPLPAKPPPSRFAVRIVTDNRAQWYGLGCGLPGSLPVPPGLAAAAARYGIPVNGKAG